MALHPCRLDGGGRTRAVLLSGSHLPLDQARCRATRAGDARAFLDVAGARIRGLDPGTVIFSGHAGGGQCGSAGHGVRDGGRVPRCGCARVPLLRGDRLSAGDVYDGLQRRVAQARSVGKPLFVAEIGMEAGSCDSLEQRRKFLGDAIAQMRTMGTAGAMFWAFVPDPRTHECTLDIGPTDPVVLHDRGRGSLRALRSR